MIDARVVLDDRAARNCAKSLQIRTLGTVGVILLAKRRGLIDSVGSTIKINKILTAATEPFEQK